MKRHIAKTEALETRFICPLLSVAASTSQIRPDQASIIVSIAFDKIRQRSIASTEEVDDLVADRPRDLRDALCEDSSTRRVARREQGQT
jgi:hypothetical protein